MRKALDPPGQARDDHWIIAELARAGYDAQAIGNREFHYMFAALAARAQQMRYPLLCSNLIDLHGRKLPFLDQLRVENAHGSIYLAALLIMQYPPGSFWERIFGWRFLDPVAVITQHAQRVRDDECFIVLSHLGLSLDRKLAAAVPRIDLLLGGHSHDTLAQPYMVGAVLIVHAGPYGRFASLTELRKERARARLDRFELVPLVPA